MAGTDSPSPRRLSAVIWSVLAGVVFLVALGLRSVPSYHHVFAGGDVVFAGTDPWFHMRTVHNLLQHMPWRSGFDPYSAFPTGQPVTTGPLFDYAIAVTAWVLGAGHPSPYLVDASGAWFPAVLGALVTVATFLLGRTLFHPCVGVLGALLVAVYPGSTFSTSRLGFADHHVLEALLASASLACLVRAVRPSVPSRRDSACAGILLGLLFITRPAAAFVVPILALWVVLQSARDHWRGAPVGRSARVVVPALLVAAIIFLPVRHLVWGRDAALALAGGVLVATWPAVLAWILNRAGVARWTYTPVLAISMTIAILAIALAWPRQAHALAQAIASRTLASDQLVYELRPLLSLHGPQSWRPAWNELTSSWIVGVPVLAMLAVRAWRRNDAALSLFVVWTAALLAATLAQQRMVVYLAPMMALLAGYCGWWLVDVRERALRIAGLAAFTACVVYPNLALTVPLARGDATMSEDWRYALRWLRERTPEPMTSPAAFDAYYPALASGARFAYPATAYGVMNWWEDGHWISAVARRIPIANGMQTGVDTAARFFTSTDPDEMTTILNRSGARYVIADARLLVPRAEHWHPRAGGFMTMPAWYGGRADEYCEVLIQTDQDGKKAPLVVFKPAYFRTALVRLWLFDGQSAGVQADTWAFTYRVNVNAGRAREIVASRRFRSYDDAVAYRNAHSGDAMVLGGVDPVRTPVPVDGLPGLRRVYWSHSDGGTGAIKIFSVGNEGH